MSYQTLTWLPPSLCGCQIQLTGDFNPASIVNGNTCYQHPRPGSITGVVALNVCTTVPSHAQCYNSATMPPTINYFTSPVATKNSVGTAVNSIQAFLANKYPNNPANTIAVQTSGYLQYPVLNQTADHCLYTLLSQSRGQRWAQPCGCSTHQWFDENGNMTYLKHPLNSNQCAWHQGDTLQMTQAVSDCTAYVSAQPPPGP
jgi:hypothetical protein